MTARSFLKPVLCVLMLALLNGCASVGREFPVQRVTQIQVGETTRADIRAMFGEPWRRGIENGQRTWTYASYRWSAFSETQTTDLVVRFNDDGTVASYVFNTTEVPGGE